MAAKITRHLILWQPFNLLSSFGLNQRIIQVSGTSHSNIPYQHGSLGLEINQHDADTGPGTIAVEIVDVYGGSMGYIRTKLAIS